MKKIVWVPIVIAAVILSIALGMRLGSGGSKPPTRTTQGSADGGGPLGPGGTAAGQAGASEDPADRDGDGRPAPPPAFVVSPDEPEVGTPVTLSDDTPVDADDSILISEWRIEGPGLTIPAQLRGEEAQFKFPQEGVYRISHRLQLEKAGLTDWVTQAVEVKRATAEATGPGGRPLVVLETVTDAQGAIDIWLEDEQVRFRVNSEALGETENGLMQNFQARLTYDNGATSGLGPGSYRMDTALVAGPALGGVSSLSISATLPSGRQWEQTFNIR